MKKIEHIWVVSLLISVVISVVLIINGSFNLNMPGEIIRSLGMLDSIAILFLVYSTIKIRKSRKSK